jgi:uncharacterized protein (TIGR04255 family)
VGAPYKNPPIAEAIAEFRFPPGSEPDLAVPGLVYEQMKKMFPKVRPAVGIEASVHANQGVIQQRFAQTPRLQMLSPDERLVVQVSPNWLAINHVPPYVSWVDEYLPAIEAAIGAYVKAADVAIIMGASLRYVNHIPVTGLGTLGLEDFFTVYPKLESGPIGDGGFRLGLQLPRAEGKSVLQVEMAPSDGPSGSGIQLDILYFHGGAAPIAVGDAKAWLTRAHEEVEAFFESAIKDSLRQRFGGRKGGGQTNELPAPTRTAGRRAPRRSRGIL